MSKVVHIINSLDKGGAELMLFKFLKNYKEENFSNTVICLNSSATMSSIFKQNNLNVMYIKTDNILDFFICIKIIFKHIQTIKPDLVMSWLHISDLIGILIKIKFPKVKLIWNLRCSSPEIKILGLRNWILVHFLSLFSKIPNCILANSVHGLESHIATGYLPQKQKVIPNGFDTNQFKPENKTNLNFFKNKKNLASNDFLIGYVGKNSKIKGLDLFIKSAGIISKKYKNVKFIFIGKDLILKNKFMFNLLNSNNCLEKSILLGEVKDLENIICHFDILSLTSRSEGFPNVIGEAMCSGVPCVSTNVGDCKIIIGDTGLIVNSFEPIDIAKAWESLYKMSSNERKNLGNKARKRIISQFSLSNIVKQYTELILDTHNGQ